MTNELKLLLESCIHQATKEGVAFVGVTLDENSPTAIIFWRNTKDTKEQMAEMFELLASDIRKCPMVEQMIGREN